MHQLIAVRPLAADAQDALLNGLRCSADVAYQSRPVAAPMAPAVIAFTARRH